MHTEAEYARLAEALAEAQKLVQILGGQRDDNLIASANANARADAAEAWLKLRDMELEVLRPRLIAAEAQVAALVEALRECSSYPCVCDPGPMDDGVCPSCSAKAWFADFSDLAPAAAKHDAAIRESLERAICRVLHLKRLHYTEDGIVAEFFGGTTMPLLDVHDCDCERGKPTAAKHDAEVLARALTVVETTLVDYGINEPTRGIHAWRCEHPDRYPDYCKCLADLMSALREKLLGVGA